MGLLESISSGWVQSYRVNGHLPKETCAYVKLKNELIFYQEIYLFLLLKVHLYLKIDVINKVIKQSHEVCYVYFILSYRGLF